MDARKQTLESNRAYHDEYRFVFDADNCLLAIDKSGEEIDVVSEFTEYYAMVACEINESAAESAEKEQGEHEKNN